VTLWVVVSEFSKCGKSESRSVDSLIYDIKRYFNYSDGCRKAISRTREVNEVVNSFMYDKNE